MSKLDTSPNCADLNDPDALSVDRALANILAVVQPISSSESLPLAELVGRVLHDTIHSPVQVPSHRNAAVDGFAIRSQDLAPTGEIKTLNLVGKSWAGHPYPSPLQPGEAVRIMTGAVMPDGADTVLMQEHTESSSDTVTFDARHSAGQNVRQAGEDIQRDEAVLDAGTLLTPPQVGLLASLGIQNITVRKRLRVAVFSTGDELLEQDQGAEAGKIYDSNRFSLISALQRMGCEVEDLGIVPDNKQILHQRLSQAAKQADVLITSGGVSVGEADFTRDVLAELGSIDFWKIAMKPGRPLAFGRIGDALFFGLPGNPVAVMVTFYFFVLPALEKKMGVLQRLIAPAFMAQSRSSMRKRAGRSEFQRGKLHPEAEGNWSVSTTGKQGSGILRSMSLADCFIILPHDGTSIKPGDMVKVQPFSGLF